MSSTRPANHHHVKPAGDSAGQPLNRVFERYRIEDGVAIAAAVVAGSVALLGFGLDSGIEAMASIIVIWRFTGTRLASLTSERRAQQLVAVSFFLLAPYIAAEAIRSLAAGDRAERIPDRRSFRGGQCPRLDPLGVRDQGRLRQRRADPVPPVPGGLRHA